MDWIKTIDGALGFIEENITEDLTVGMIAAKMNISAFYFQKGFSMLCGYTVGEYIRLRRLSLAGSDLLTTDEKVIDLAMKYGYDSADSFTKAFVRFHGCTPTDVRKKGANVKSFAPLHIKLMLDGGTVMEYRIETMPAFKVMGISENFSYETANAEIPAFWNKAYFNRDPKPIAGKYGVCFDEEMAGNEFRYMIADDYNEQIADAHALDAHEIPAHTWAVFPCRGPMPSALQNVSNRIFSEWLPASCYSIAEGYNVEYYSDPADYPRGMQDPDYYTEVWIPVKEK